MRLLRLETPVPLPMQSDDNAGQERPKYGGHSTRDRAAALVGAALGEGHTEKRRALQRDKPPCQ
jgi:hypothetical protein